MGDRRSAAIVGVRLAVGFVLVMGFAGCGSDEGTAAAPTMPDVVGSQLDVALSDIERAGFEDEVEVLGGGALGVVVESNWQVCEQLPAAGEALTGEPRLTVDRSCGEDDPEPEPEPPTPVTDPEPTTSAPASEESIPEVEEPEAYDYLSHLRESAAGTPFVDFIVDAQDCGGWLCVGVQTDDVEIQHRVCTFAGTTFDMQIQIQGPGDVASDVRSSYEGNGACDLPDA